MSIEPDNNSPPVTGLTGGIEPKQIVDTPSDLTIQESLLNDSRITPDGNGHRPSSLSSTQPTSGQKWWAAVLLGFIFAIISSPAAYYTTSTITTSLGGISLTEGQGPNFAGLLIHTIVFIIIVRLILW
jgi:hypothetical protein